MKWKEKKIAMDKLRDQIEQDKLKINWMKWKEKK